MPMPESPLVILMFHYHQLLVPLPLIIEGPAIASGLSALNLHPWLRPSPGRGLRLTCQFAIILDY